MHRGLIERAIAHCGSQQELADRMKCTQPYISYLLRQPQKVSVKAALSIERATDGMVKARDLRPDFEWPPEAAAPDAPEAA